MAFTNRCDICGLFRPWGELQLHFTPDTAFSSEDESYQECKRCRSTRSPRRPRGGR